MRCFSSTVTLKITFYIVLNLSFIEIRVKMTKYNALTGNWHMLLSSAVLGHFKGVEIGDIGPHLCILGLVAQTVTCLVLDACLTADPRVWTRSRPSSILSWRFIKKYFLLSFSSLQIIHSKRVVVSYKQMHVH